MPAFYIRTKGAWTDVTADSVVVARRLAYAFVGSHDYQIFAMDDDGGFDEAADLNSRAALGAEYEALVGYNPFDDEPSLTAADVIQTIDEVTEEAKAASLATERGDL